MYLTRPNTFGLAWLARKRSEPSGLETTSWSPIKDHGKELWNICGSRRRIERVPYIHRSGCMPYSIPCHLIKIDDVKNEYCPPRDLNRDFTPRTLPSHELSVTKLRSAAAVPPVETRSFIVKSAYSDLVFHETFRSQTLFLLQGVFRGQDVNHRVRLIGSGTL
jgi:hypothetical protein